jgi:hypothetical protein
MRNASAVPLHASSLSRMARSAGRRRPRAPLAAIFNATAPAAHNVTANVTWIASSCVTRSRPRHSPAR